MGGKETGVLEASGPPSRKNLGNSVLLCKVEFLYLPSGVGVVEELNST